MNILDVGWGVECNRAFLMWTKCLPTIEKSHIAEVCSLPEQTREFGILNNHNANRNIVILPKRCFCKGRLAIILNVRIISFASFL